MCVCAHETGSDPSQLMATSCRPVLPLLSPLFGVYIILYRSQLSLCCRPSTHTTVPCPRLYIPQLQSSYRYRITLPRRRTRSLHRLAPSVSSLSARSLPSPRYPHRLAQHASHILHAPVARAHRVANPEPAARRLLDQGRSSLRPRQHW